MKGKTMKNKIASSLAVLAVTVAAVLGGTGVVTATQSGEAVASAAAPTLGMAQGAKSFWCMLGFKASWC